MTEAINAVPRNEDLLEGFEKWLIVRNLAKCTRCNYVRHVRKFIEYLEPKSVTSATPADVRAFKMALSEKYESRATLALSQMALRKFYKSLILAGITKNFPVGPALKQKRPPIPRVMTESEVAQLLGATRNSLEKAIIEMLYASGLRLAELADLDIENVDFHSEMLRVRGKGLKDRLIPLGTKAASALRDYLGKRKGGGPVFIKPNPKLGKERIYRLFMEIAKRAGLPDVHPHTMRHTFSTHLMHHGMNLRYIQELLGHSSISTTQLYLHHREPDLVSIYEQCHPHGKEGSDE